MKTREPTRPQALDVLSTGFLPVAPSTRSRAGNLQTLTTCEVPSSQIRVIDRAADEFRLGDTRFLMDALQQ
jgi:hypothetical protein